MSRPAHTYRGADRDRGVMTLATIAHRHPLLAFAADAPDWTGAACRDWDPEIWFHDDQANTQARIDTALAKLICNEDCPLRDTCRAWAIQQRIPYGVYGGLTATERDATAPACDQCGQPYKRRNSQQRYCSADCSQAARQKKKRSYEKRGR